MLCVQDLPKEAGAVSLCRLTRVSRSPSVAHAPLCRGAEAMSARDQRLANKARGRIGAPAAIGVLSHDHYYQGIHAGRDAKDNLGVGMIPDAGAARGEAFANFYSGIHAGRDVKDNLGAGMVPDAGAARGEAFGGFYGDAHTGRDVKDNLGPGMVPDAKAAAGERFGGWYGGAHAGKDTRDNLGPGMIPDAGAAAGDRFRGVYGNAHAGKDTKDNLGPGMVPKADAARGDAFADYYQGIHAGRDAKDNLGPGMVPDAGAARGEAFAGFYGGIHAGRDVKDNLGAGMIPDAGAARGEAFGDFYGGIHAGRDARDNLGPGMIPEREWYHPDPRPVVEPAKAAAFSEHGRRRAAMKALDSAAARTDEEQPDFVRQVTIDPGIPAAGSRPKAGRRAGAAPVAAEAGARGVANYVTPLDSLERMAELPVLGFAAAQAEIAMLKAEVNRLNERVAKLEARGGRGYP